jgi:hypothetical protein
MPESNKKSSLSREVMSRIRRRANALSIKSRGLFTFRLEGEVKCGVISPAQIETWTPPELAESNDHGQHP